MASFEYELLPILTATLFYNNEVILKNWIDKEKSLTYHELHYE